MSMITKLATKLRAALSVVAVMAMPVQALDTSDMAFAFGAKAAPAGQQVDLASARGMTATEMQETEGAVLVPVIRGLVTGFTKHGINRTIERGVKPDAIRDTLTNPKTVKPGTTANTTKYVGEKSIVVLNDSGKVVTVIGKGK